MERIGKFLNTDNLNQHDFKCTMMVHYILAVIFWIQIPCDEPILDHATLHCQMKDLKPREIRKLTTESCRASEGDGRVSKKRGNVGKWYTCLDNTSISSFLLCDTKADCICGDEETHCTTSPYLHRSADLIISPFHSFLKLYLKHQ